MPVLKEHTMTNDILERRALEMLIRRAEAEERLLERRLERVASDQARARRSIDVLMHRQPYDGMAG
jgi:hypothetical protein